MLELILKKTGVQKLNKKEKRSINGGLACKLEQDGSYSCPPGTYCAPSGLCKRI